MLRVYFRTISGDQPTEQSELHGPFQEVITVYGTVYGVNVDGTRTELAHTQEDDGWVDTNGRWWSDWLVIPARE